MNIKYTDTITKPPFAEFAISDGMFLISPRKMFMAEGDKFCHAAETRHSITNL